MNQIKSEETKSHNSIREFSASLFPQLPKADIPLIERALPQTTVMRL